MVYASIPVERETDGEDVGVGIMLRRDSEQIAFSGPGLFFRATADREFCQAIQASFVPDSKSIQSLLRTTLFSLRMS